MGFFDFGPQPSHRRVTHAEFKDKVLPQLHAMGFHGTDIGIIEGLVMGNMDDGNHARSGVDEHELREIVEWLTKERSKHTLSSHQIEQFEKLMTHYIDKVSSSL